MIEGLSLLRSLISTLPEPRREDIYAVETKDARLPSQGKRSSIAGVLEYGRLGQQSP